MLLLLPVLCRFKGLGCIFLSCKLNECEVASYADVENFGIGLKMPLDIALFGADRVEVDDKECLCRPLVRGCLSMGLPTFTLKAERKLRALLKKINRA